MAQEWRDLNSEEMINNTRTMGEFVELGFLYLLNRDFCIPRGFYIGFYIDETAPNQPCLGWLCVPYSEALKMGVIPSMKDVTLREEALNSFECC